MPQPLELREYPHCVRSMFHLTGRAEKSVQPYSFPVPVGSPTRQAAPARSGDAYARMSAYAHSYEPGRHRIYSRSIENAKSNKAQ
jgi:hypothetical protein